MPLLAAADLAGVLITGTPPLMWPFSIVALASSALALVGGGRRARGGGPPLPEMTLANAALGLLYLMHWFVVIPWVTARMALLPKRLIWAKTLHHGDVDVDGELGPEGEGELAAGGGQA
jgi:1,2-diacylglycerol 3-beta-glucosyltransferase